MYILDANSNNLLLFLYHVYVCWWQAIIQGGLCIVVFAEMIIYPRHIFVLVLRQELDFQRRIFFVPLLSVFT